MLVEWRLKNENRHGPCRKIFAIGAGKLLEII
jgi:hypothetical protein